MTHDPQTDTRTSHDPMCPYFPEQQGFGGIDSGVPSTQPYIRGVPCQCALIAKVREDERSKYVLPDLPRSEDHVDWCRDLACYGCVEVTE